ncbi:ferritin-like domain-containing protein [Nocardia huaxiensis]|uniref:ferritin-like domain-containing protein n=1 Tax=Nocardia huaxiensis TaxID=2755382 RepID=UPI001C66E05D|nr:ferritin-like domain-containing protein [Nocardia huaxiensis]UFS99324.1 ferritin-like domain-containing protein [Nocardia huaxiensis]
MHETVEFSRWTTEFEAKVAARAATGDPDWACGARLDPAVVRSVQRFQVGESGDGANLMAKAEQAGDPVYAAAVRLFIAEERNHARLLACLLEAAGEPTIAAHWVDAVFVRLRRALGLRLELMVLTIAEVVALRYYRALRDGTSDPLTTRVAALILDDERRHVPFHCQRLRAAFATTPRPARVAAGLAWWVILLGAVLVVAADHGPALRVLGVSRTVFARDVIGLFRGVRRSVTRSRRRHTTGPLRRWAAGGHRPDPALPQ